MKFYRLQLDLADFGRLSCSGMRMRDQFKRAWLSADWRLGWISSVWCLIICQDRSGLCSWRKLGFKRKQKHSGPLEAQVWNQYPIPPAHSVGQSKSKCHDRFTVWRDSLHLLVEGAAESRDKGHSHREGHLCNYSIMTYRGQVALNTAEIIYLITTV